MDSAGTKRILRPFHLHSVNQEPDELQTIKNVSRQGDKVSIAHEEDELHPLVWRYRGQTCLLSNVMEQTKNEYVNKHIDGA